MFVYCLVKLSAFSFDVFAILLFLNSIVLLYVWVGFLFDRLLMVFHSVCVFFLWSHDFSKNVCHSVVLCFWMSLLISSFIVFISSFRGFSALSVFLCFILFLIASGRSFWFGLILPFGMYSLSASMMDDVIKLLAW